MRLRTKPLFVSPIWIKGKADIMKSVSLSPAYTVTYSVNKQASCAREGLGTMRGSEVCRVSSVPTIWVPMFYWMNRHELNNHISL